jgi:hypothetical protein
LKKLTFISRIIALLIVILVILYVFIANTAPFTITKIYDTKSLGPGDRINKLPNGNIVQTKDLIYFNTKMPFKFDKAKVKITYNNFSQNQELRLGYQDQKEWHYNTQTFDNPILNNLNMKRIGNGPYLYQKNLTYTKINDFIRNPPKDKVIGVINFPSNNYLQPKINMPGYTPSKINSKISTPLRGKITFYAYLKNEPFNMNISKQDLNWYKDPDVVKISVFKGKDIVYDATIDDDGNQTDNHESTIPESIGLKNPGPGLPESGVYKIIIDQSSDSLITNITTNLHKLAFEGPLYVADNHEVYKNVVTKTNPSLLITNAQKLGFRSDHGQSKIAVVDKQIITITQPNQVFPANNYSPSANITIPTSDMVINGSGYFAFSLDQYFAPTPYKILPIISSEDVSQSDYLLTSYPGTPKHKDGWSITEQSFNLKNAHLEKGRLSWIIAAPNLTNNKNTIEIKNIEVQMTKKGWLRN